MARGKASTKIEKTDIEVPTIETLVEAPTVEIPVESPTLDKSPELKETSPTVEIQPEVEKAPKHLVCTATLLPGGKYQVMHGNKFIGRFGKEKAEKICKNFNK